MAENKIIRGSTGIESSMPGSNAILMAKGVSRAMTSSAVSSRVTSSHTASSATGTRATIALPLYHRA